MPPAIDLRGRRFGRLKVLSPLDRRCHGQIVWRCRCRCGRHCEVLSWNLRSGNTLSCGCYHAELVTLTLGERRRLSASVRRGTARRTP